MISEKHTENRSLLHELMEKGLNQQQAKDVIQWTSTLPIHILGLKNTTIIIDNGIVIGSPTPKIKDVGKQKRISIVNKIIEAISSTGRGFFNYDGRTAYIFIKNKKLYMLNEWHNKEMCLHERNGYRPELFHHGGTLWGLVKDFIEYIDTGNKSNGLNGYGGLFSANWGYTDQEMDSIRKIARELGYL